MDRAALQTARLKLFTVHAWVENGPIRLLEYDMKPGRKTVGWSSPLQVGCRQMNFFVWALQNGSGAITSTRSP